MVNDRKFTLIVNPSESRCGNCGKGATWREETHQTVLGYYAQGVDPGPGCGVRWVFITSDYMNVDGLELQELRPDLVVLEPPSWSR